MTPREDRWQHLLAAATAVESAAEPRDELSRNLDSVLEVFSPELDPVDDFEAACVRRFALAVRRALEST
jgi:hypothetical protein